MASDIELLKQKRALELRRNFLLAEAKQRSQSKPKPEEVVSNPLIVRGILTGRGFDVMETARRYYPAEIDELERRLALLVRNGRLKGPVSGEELYSFLRQMGLDFNMDTKIRIKEGGRLKNLAEKLRGNDD